jgi:hypothetical protein
MSCLWHIKCRRNVIKIAKITYKQQNKEKMSQKMPFKPKFTIVAPARKS